MDLLKGGVWIENIKVLIILGILHLQKNSLELIAMLVVVQLMYHWYRAFLVITSPVCLSKSRDINISEISVFPCPCSVKLGRKRYEFMPHQEIYAIHMKQESFGQVLFPFSNKEKLNDSPPHQITCINKPKIDLDFLCAKNSPISTTLKNLLFFHKHFTSSICNLSLCVPSLLRSRR